MKQLHLFLLCWLASMAAMAQQRVSGRVTDAETGEGLIGVTVTLRGGAAGTVTDVEGRYVLEVPDLNGTLVFTYTGYVEQQIPLQGRTTLDVAMAPQVEAIGEIVVVGYGTQRKSDLTGAVGTVKTREIERIPTASVDQALQGKIAGVYVVPASGRPGDGAVVRIRGTGTLNNANPLYVVDGMLLEDASFVNPLDVESVEVLKDASATAIYGNRGANGVIIITTKRGKAGERAAITVNSYYGTQSLTHQVPMANAAEFAQMYNELQGQPFFPNPQALGAGTNWQDVVYRQAPMASIQVSAAGGSDKFTYNVAGNYFTQSGILRESEFERVTLRLNNEYQVNKAVRLGNNLSFASANSQNAPGVLLSTLWMPPVYAERDSTGKFSDPTFFGTAIGNPAADLFYKNNNFSRNNRLVGTLYGDLKFLKYFAFRSNFGLDYGLARSRYYEPVFQVSVSQRNANDRLELGFNENRSWLWENTLTFDRSWKHLRVNALAGYTAQETRFEYFGASRSNFPSGIDELLYLSAGNDTTQLNYGGAGEWAMVSYLGRVNLTLFERYLLTASIRADGSSRFSPKNRWGYFPSFAVGWNIAQEPFMAQQRLFDRLKLRASWGVVGNDKTQLYPSFGIIQGNLYAIFGPNEALNTGATLTTLANPDVRWEETSQIDIGLEMALLNGRLTAEVDWYNRLTYDILYELPIPDYVGSAGNPVVNVADVRNRGWDITLGWRDTRGKVSYNLGAILSTVHNEVVELDARKSEVRAAGTSQGDFATRTVVGRSIGEFHGFRVVGIFQNAEDLNKYPRLGNERPGDFRYQDTNGDGKITDADKVFLGSPIPKLTYGFSAGIEWAGFDLAADFFGVYGNKVVSAWHMSRFGVYNWHRRFYEGRWTGEGTSDEVPRVTNGGHNYRMSSFYVQDGSFLRLRSLIVGYTLPQTLTRRAGIQRARLYFNGTNLWTRQAYDGYSPEFPGSSVFTAGVDYGSYPIAKTVSFGLDITF
ncbi:MAG: TonB-dependent receptor [Saprospiraceae bacterium]|nr:TonB-dependent receptor [Saprospiraceae bacterium]